MPSLPAASAFLGLRRASWCARRICSPTVGSNFSRLIWSRGMRSGSCASGGLEDAFTDVSKHTKRALKRTRAEKAEPRRTMPATLVLFSPLRPSSVLIFTGNSASATLGSALLEICCRTASKDRLGALKESRTAVGQRLQIRRGVANSRWHGLILLRLKTDKF